MNKIQKQCEVCGQSFVPKTVDSVYCSKKCGAAAYRKKKVLAKKEAEQKAVIDKISADRLYISVPEAIALFGIAKSTLYRLVRQKCNKQILNRHFSENSNRHILIETIGL